MALNPNVVVVAPGELITADHLNNVRANLDRIDALLRLPLVKAVPIAGNTSPVTLSTSYQFLGTSTAFTTPPAGCTIVAVFQTTLNVTAAGRTDLRLVLSGDASLTGIGMPFSVTSPLGFHTHTALLVGAVVGNVTVGVTPQAASVSGAASIAAGVGAGAVLIVGNP